MNVTITRAESLQGTLTVPPDKAVCHRTLLVAAVARGDTEIRPWPEADDCQRTLQVMQQVGVPARRLPDAVRISGRGLEGLQPPAQALFCGESGTTLRLAAGLLAGQPFTSCLSAGPLLSRRPMRRIAEPLSQMGVRLDGSVSSAVPGELCPPLSIHGRRPLHAIRYEMPVASAQVKSAILLAGLFADGRTTVIERQPTRDHTERMLRRCGVTVQVDGPAVSLEPRAPTAPGVLVLPGDFSSAAFFLVAASCVPGSRLLLRGVSLNPTRTGLLEVLRRMGASVRTEVEEEDWEPRGTVMVEARPLQGVTVEAQEVSAMIDELPILMVAASCAQGTTRFNGVGELRVKETDRVQSMLEALARMRGRIGLAGRDAVEITGGALRGSEVPSAGDHRTAMSLAVAGLTARGETTILGAECVSKSFPQFFELLAQVAGSSTVKTVDKA